MIKIGDKVIIARKPENDQEKVWVDSMDATIGGTGIVVEKRDYRGYVLLDNYGFWYPIEALQKIEGEKEMNKITIKNLWPHLCDDWKEIIIQNFADEYGWSRPIPEKLALDFEVIFGMGGWLSEHGFIKKERTYKVGDRFFVHGCKYVVAAVGNSTIMGINPDTGGRITDHKIKVKDCKKISEEEIRGIFGHNFLTFEKAVWEDE